MQPCVNCGQPRIGGKKFCTRCGTRFPDDEITAGAAHVPLATGRSPYRSVALGAAGGVVLAGIGIGAWFLVGHSGGHASAGASQAGNVVTSTRPTGNPATGSPVPGSPAAGSAAAGSPAAGSPAAGSPAAGSTGLGSASDGPVTPPPGPVAIAPAAARDPAASQITAFLDQYFAAINAHDYQAYVALLSPQAQGITQSQFDSGYGSTTDTDETLSGVSAAANGDSVAHVMFTSHQSASESPTSTTCNVWNISLYLVPNAGGYLIDTPPSSYHAGFAACS
jgi:hypothetical protein